MARGLIKCIYCREHPADGEEHYLPFALGKFEGFEMLKNRICRVCNESFSSLEEQFCGPSPEGMFRQMLGIKGRKRPKKKSPFYDRYSGVGPLKMTGVPVPGTNPILWEIIPGQNKVRELSHFVLTDEQGNVHYLPN